MNRKDAKRLVEELARILISHMKIETPFGPAKLDPKVVCQEGCFDEAIRYVMMVFDYEVGEARYQTEQLLGQFYESNRILLVKPSDHSIQWLYGGEQDGTES